MYYVSMLDSFMSGWGMAEGKESIYIIECDLEAEADHVADVAENHRTDMSRVNITSGRPTYYNKDTHRIDTVHFDELSGIWTKDYEAA